MDVARHGELELSLSLSHPALGLSSTYKMLVEVCADAAKVLVGVVSGKR